MLSLALTVAVLSSSGGLLSGYESQHVRLIDAAEVIGGAALGQQGQTVDQMKQHLADLEDSLPGFVLPIVLMGAGVATEILGLVLSGAAYGLSALYWVGFILYVLAGPALIIVGGIILIVTIVKRVKITREIRSVERQIQAAESGGGGYQPLPSGPTPPPPPTSLLSTPTSSLVLAEF
jgi:hypothetical protein